MADHVGQQLGNYRLLRLLGQGSFAAVYLGEHLYLERPAAIKVLHVQMEPGTFESFRREARTIAQLHHPHIVGVHDFGIVEQTPYLVMEYTPGGTLRELYPKGTCLSFEQIITYVKQIASALDYAHQQRVIHRDIKPANLLLNAKGEVVLSDFGLAVVERTLESLSEQNAAGTPLYMAPEQIQHHPCPASDQYALGVMVYEWLCGEPPFPGPGIAVFGQHLHQPPPSLCVRLPQLPPAVEDAVFGALAKDPAQRFATVQEFAIVLEEAYFATQPLSLRRFTEQSTHEQKVPPVLLAGPLSAERAHDRSDETTQPRVMAVQRRGRTQASEQLMSPASPSHLVSKQTKLSVAQRNRQILLRKMHAFWIEGVLKHSLHGAALLTLGLQAQPDAIANPWHLVLQHPETSPQPLPTGTRITQVYDDAEGELLVLGAPGAGKTTLLLELARDLLVRAEQDEQHPMPVVFNLSSWGMKQQNLTDWLVEDLNTKYQVPSKLGQALVEADQILPLLDGLDEVAPTARTACIEAINRYQQEHGLFPLVVCSRQADYLAQAGRLLVRSAVTVQPLTQEQVDAYLAQGGEPLWALRLALHQDAALRELTSTPLMLSILTLTYHGKPVEELLRGTSMEERQRQIFEQYVRRMLTRRGPLKAGTAQQVVQWLTYLAARMRERNQTVFYLERLQPDWLSGDRMLQTYDRWAVHFPAILIGVLVSLTTSLVLFSATPFSTPFSVSVYVRKTLLGGFVGWLLGVGRTTLQRDERSARARGGIWPRLVVGGLIGLGYGLDAVLDVGVEQGAELRYWLVAGVINGLSVGLGSILLQIQWEKSKTIMSDVQPRPPYREQGWQRFLRHRDIRYGLLTGLLLGLSAGLGAGIAIWLTDSMAGIRLNTALIEGLGGGVNIALADGLAIGLSGGLLSWLTTAALLFGKREGRGTTALLFFRYFRYDCKSAAMCSKRSMVTSSLTPMYLL